MIHKVLLYLRVVVGHHQVLHSSSNNNNNSSDNTIHSLVGVLVVMDKVVQHIHTTVHHLVVVVCQVQVVVAISLRIPMISLKNSLVVIRLVTCSIWVVTWVRIRNNNEHNHHNTSSD